MIVLDTNVLSELMRAQPDGKVLAWLDRQAAHTLSLTAVTVAELQYGIERLPEGRRKVALRHAAQAMLEQDFAGRVLAFDETAALHYGPLVASREAMGRPISLADAQIAAICRRYDASLATRNGRDFEATGLEVVDPWHAA
jgi:predicted nucleic acid-binding protein